jgi:formylglycine-generating enzyme required for sulfatase activity
MASDPSHFKGESLPVEQVSWEDCQKFCRETGLRLPTEAEWEYACRAGSGEAFCFGADSRQLGDYAWYEEDSGCKTHPVGTKAANAFGLHDTHGNIFEWCQDVFFDAFYSKPEATGIDPVCSSGSGARVVRGGSWEDVARYCRSASRGGLDPTCRGDWVGLRLAGP